MTLKLTEFCWFHKNVNLFQIYKIFIECKLERVDVAIATATIRKLTELCVAKKLIIMKHS